MSPGKVILLVVALVVALGAGVAVGALLGGGDEASPGAIEEPPGSTGATTDSGGETTPDSGTDTTDTPVGPSGTGSCDFAPGDPYVGGPSVALETIGEADGVVVSGAMYPHPDYEGDPWTMWGQGLIIRDGSFLSAIGDHIGPDGNSYLYEYDPATGELSMIGDVLSYADHEPGSWGYGKIHGQLVSGACGEVYFATYWGSNRDLRFDGSYIGDVMYRLDPATETISYLGTPIERHGIPSLAGSVDGRYVFGEAIDPLLEIDDIDQGPFFVYDTVEQEYIYVGDPTPHIGFRNVMVGGDGRAYYAIGNGQLAVWDPSTNEVTTHTSTMPGEALRASTKPTADGRVFGVTDDEAEMFVMSRSGEITPLGPARGYTTSMAVHPDGDRFFYIPDAHGGAWETGAPLISVDGETGEETVVVELNPMAEDGLGVRLGGTYGLAVDPSGNRIYIGMNTGPLGSEDGFGDVALLVVELP